MKHGQILEIKQLSGLTGLFSDRHEAGQVLSRLISPLGLPHPLVLAIPAGGVPVAASLAEALGCQLDVAVVSKITLPWNTEAGYGAVAFDGSSLLNDAMLKAVGLSEQEVIQGIESTRVKVLRRVGVFRKELPMPDLTEREVVVVDDGLASGFTMQAAIAALRRAGAQTLIVAVPTGHEHAVHHLAKIADMVCCANIRSGPSFAVAAAYQHWEDVAEAEAEEILSTFYGA